LEQFYLRDKTLGATLGFEIAATLANCLQAKRSGLPFFN
jgi:hypothetical protein